MTTTIDSVSAATTIDTAFGPLPLHGTWIRCEQLTRDTWQAVRADGSLVVVRGGEMPEDKRVIVLLQNKPAGVILLKLRRKRKS